MQLAQLFRRCAAEGLPTSVSAMLTVIQTVGARMRTNGRIGRSPALDLSDAQMREMLTEMSTFCGGYMYSGEWADSPQVGSIQAPIRHWVQEYDTRDRYRVEYQAYLDDVLAKALIINYGSQSRSDDLYTARYQRDGDVWRFTGGYCRQTELRERNNLFLPDGIFKSVAAHLGVTPSTTYKRLFDAAVESYYE